MKTIRILAVLLAGALFALGARAWQLEAGLGVSHTQPQPNGTWYQEGFPYRLDLTKASWYIGARHQLAPHWTAHVDYMRFGVLHADAIATTDADYNASTRSCVATPCVAQSHFVGSGLSDGLKVAAQWTPGGDGWGLIGGVFVFKPRWHTTVYDWRISTDMEPRTIEHSITQRWTVRPMIGVAYRRGPWDVRLEQFFNKPYDSWNTGLGQATTMLSLGRAF